MEKEQGFVTLWRVKYHELLNTGQPADKHVKKANKSGFLTQRILSPPKELFGSEIGHCSEGQVDSFWRCKKIFDFVREARARCTQSKKDMK